MAGFKPPSLAGFEVTGDKVVSYPSPEEISRFRGLLQQVVPQEQHSGGVPGRVSGH
jgi:hypothetical protein